MRDLNLSLQLQYLGYKVKILKTVHIILLSFVICASLNAQQRLTTLTGQKLILQPDGTWQYDIMSIKEDSTGMLHAELNPLKTPQTKKYHINENHQKGLTLMTDTILSREIIQVILFERLKEKLSNQTELLLAAKKDTLKDLVYISMLDSSRQETKQNINRAEKAYNLLFKQYNKIQSLFDAKEDYRNKTMKSLANDLGINVGAYTTLEDVKKKVSANLSLAKSTIDFKPKVTCLRDTTYVGEDRKGVSTNFIRWYDYSPLRMKNLLKTNDLVTSYCAIAKHHGKYYLRVRIVIASKDAFKTYGSIPAGNFMKVVLTTGKTLHILNAQDSKGMIENYTGHVVYHAQFHIKSDDVSLFRKNPIDTIGIMWSSGFEVYPIYEVDAVMNAFDCFDSL